MLRSLNGIESDERPGEDYKLLQGDLKDSEIFAETSMSVCPECLKLIECQILFRDNKVYMRKNCKTHGSFEVMIYSDADAYLDSAQYNKPGAAPLHYQGSMKKGCPEDCGLCEAHRQHTCVGVIEIIDRCNQDCPVCFTDSKNSFTLPLERVKELIDLYVKCEGEPEVLQISGGEPTLHPDIIEILEYAGQMGIIYPMLNTNGLKLADRDFAERISQTMQNEMHLKKPLIYLQFDGLSDETYKALRGRPLIDIKMKALKNCRELGMNVTLVPTIVSGINEHEIGPIIDLALSDSNIKMVNFQPSTQTGRYELDDKENKRITIPEILNEIETQTKGVITKNSFINIPCPHPTCSVCSYIYKDGEKVMLLTELFDMDDYMHNIVNRSVPDPGLLSKVNKAIDTLLSMSAVMGSQSTEKAICTSCGIAIPNIGELIDNVTLISVHAFMDEHNFDLKRAQKCCVTEILPNGQMIPFCVYNILYRKQFTSTNESLG